MSQETESTDVMSRLAAHFDPATPEVTPDEPPVDTSPAPQAQEAVAEEASADAEQPDQPEETDSAGNLVDIEFDGKVLKGSPEIREAVMRHADYTKKTMELSEHRALFQKEREIADQHAAFSKSIESESQELAQIDAQLTQFKALPWDEFDTQQTLRAKMAQDNLKERKAELKQSVDAKRGEFTQQAEKSRQELFEKADKYLAKAIPQWGKQAASEFVAAAEAVGFTRAEVSNMTDPRAVQALWKAAQWDKLQAAKPSVSKKVSEVPPVIKPGSQATTESKATTQLKDARDRLKKSGDVRDAQRLFAQMK